MLSRLLIVATVLLLAGCGVTSGLQVQHRGRQGGRAALAPAAQPAPRCVGGGPAGTLGQAAFIHRGALQTVLIATCRTATRTLIARGALTPVHFSADGRWVAYGQGTVVSLDRREIVRPLGQAVIAWQWVGESDKLVGVTDGGGLVIGAPAQAPRPLLPNGWGANSLSAARDGTIAVSRVAGGASGSASIWTLSASHPRPVLAYSAPRGTEELQLAQFAPGDKALAFWVNRYGSASLVEDGLRLQLLTLDQSGTAVTLSTLSPAHSEAVTTCGDRLVFVAGGGREGTLGKRLASAYAVDGWQAESLTYGSRSAVSPSCAPEGDWLAAAIGPNGQWHAGQEQRSIELFPMHNGRRTRLSTPPPGSSDESPRVTGGGRWVLFIRSKLTRDGATGAGYLISTSKPGSRPIGPLFIAGPASDYYGTYNWTETVAFTTAGQRK
jgi:hypothetical protein